MTDRLPHVREPSSGEPDVCVHCLEEWIDLLTLYERDECSVRLRAELDRLRAEVDRGHAHTLALEQQNIVLLRSRPRTPFDLSSIHRADIEELIGLINARVGIGPYRIDKTLSASFALEYEHYWVLRVGEVSHRWQHGVPTPDRPVGEPCIEWTADPDVALGRILAVERRRSAAGHKGRA